MTSTEVEELIKMELQVEPDITNVFGLDQTKCLIKPTRQKYKTPMTQRTFMNCGLWLKKQKREMAQIYFDIDAKIFGLAIKSDEDELIDISGYGSFLKTLYSM